MTCENVTLTHQKNVIKILAKLYESATSNSNEIADRLAEAAAQEAVDMDDNHYGHKNSCQEVMHEEVAKAMGTGLISLP